MCLGELGYSLISSLTGNTLVDHFMVLSAEYFVFVIPLVLVYLWFMSGHGKKDSLFSFYTVLAGIVFSYVLGLLYFHEPPHLQGFETILNNDPVNAFPSQHSAAVFSLVWPLLYRKRNKLGVLAGFSALMTAFARVYTGLHFPADIAGGVLASFLAFGVVYFMEEYLENLSESIVGTWERVEKVLVRFLKEEL